MKQDKIRPTHYKENKGIEVIEFTNSHNLNFNVGNVVKYIVRSPYKTPDNQKLDLEKALQYMKFEATRLEGVKQPIESEYYLKEKGIDCYSFLDSHKIKNNTGWILANLLFNKKQSIDLPIELLTEYINTLK